MQFGTCHRLAQLLRHAGQFAHLLGSAARALSGLLCHHKNMLNVVATSFRPAALCCVVLEISSISCARRRETL